MGCGIEANGSNWMREKRDHGKWEDLQNALMWVLGRTLEDEDNSNRHLRHRNARHRNKHNTGQGI